MRVHNFAEAREYLESLIPKQGERNVKDPMIWLQRMRCLLALMGDPQNSYPTIHITGTAGKGSTATIIAAILQQAGYRTGLHVSPHLEDIRERMRVDGKLVSKAGFVKEVNALAPFIRKTGQRHPYGKPTYFEALVALAFEHFRNEGVDVAVIEVGLGGTFDGTNVIVPKVAVLTNVGLDHTEILGRTVEKIARDKSGIFKKGIDAVSGVTQPSVIRIVERRARKMHDALDLLDRDIHYKIRESSLKQTVFDLKTREESFEGLKSALVGDHQVRNAALAVDAALKLRKHGFKITNSDVRRALSKIQVPGRFEIVGSNPTIILDGAHNPMKIEALVQTLKQHFKEKPISFVIAIKKRKDAKTMMKIISKLNARFYITQFQATTDFGKRMSYGLEELGSLANGNVQMFDNGEDAYRQAVNDAGKGGVVCVTGSLYLVGELRPLALKKS